MEEAPGREQLKTLIVSICEEQEKIRKVIGPPKAFQQSLAASLEPLKTPICFLWETLGYGNFPQNSVQLRWLALFKTSPSDFISECIVQIKNGDIPVDDFTLRRTLMDFFSELAELYNS